MEAPIDAHEGERVHDTELQEELYRLERHVLARRADRHRRQVGDLRRRVDDELDPVPRPPEVVPARREGAFDPPVARAHAGRTLLDLHDRAPPQPQQSEAEEEDRDQPGQYASTALPEKSAKPSR